MFNPTSFSNLAFASTAFSGLVAGEDPGLDPTVPFVYALVPVGPLSRQDFPGAPVTIVDPNTYTAPFLRLLNGDDVAGPEDFRGFTVVLPSVTRTDFS